MKLEKRWNVEIHYRTNNGTKKEIAQIEELDDLYDLVEKGPNWFCIDNIKIVINPKRDVFPKITLEQAFLD